MECDVVLDEHRKLWAKQNRNDNMFLFYFQCFSATFFRSLSFRQTSEKLMTNYIDENVRLAMSDDSLLLLRLPF